MPPRNLTRDELRRSEELAKHIGNRVRYARHERDWTQTVLSERMGRTTSWVSFIERGEFAPTVPDLIRLSEVLQKPLAFFLERHLPPVRPEKPEDWYALFPGKPEWAENFALLHKVLLGAEKAQQQPEPALS